MCLNDIRGSTSPLTPIYVYIYIYIYIYIYMYIGIQAIKRNRIALCMQCKLAQSNTTMAYRTRLT